MRCLLLFLLAIAVPSQCLGAETALTNRFDKLVTLNNEELKNVIAKRIEWKEGADNHLLVVFHSKGISKIPMRLLSDDTRKSIGVITRKEIKENQAREEKKRAYAKKVATARAKNKKAREELERPSGKDDFTVAKETSKERTKQIQVGFSAWSGSHIKLTRHIKSNMHDPKSYKHVETVYWDKNDYILVRQKFRGKNALGATVLNYALAKATVEGEIIEVLEVGLW